MFSRTRIGLIVVIGLALLINSGCATTGRKESLQVQGLKNQVMVLENKLLEKEQDIYNLNEALNARESKAPVTAISTSAEVKSRPNIKQIQLSLKNAGYDVGALDGKMGAKTKSAIKEFQKSNNLKADGNVGPKTWKLLRPYLDKKIK
ncbi:MAG: peptidoglycan-binding domain-containing protein [Candidatus Omnitrophota bacterium]|nr:peptidoglycan-binding protein [Candidatus Omnitrophota bacterium]